MKNLLIYCLIGLSIASFSCTSHKTSPTNIEYHASDNNVQYMLNNTVMVLSSKGVGTGVIVEINNEIKIITAYHVIDYDYKKDENANFVRKENARIRIYTREGKLLKVKLEHVSMYDIAIYDVELTKINVPQLRKDKIKVGETIYHVGHMQGLRYSLTKGIISHNQRFFKPYKNNIVMPHLQYDATSYAGSSGGPLFDQEGRVVGIVTQMLNNVETTGSAVPSTSIIAYYNKQP